MRIHLILRLGSESATGWQIAGVAQGILDDEKQNKTKSKREKEWSYCYTTEKTEMLAASLLTRYASGKNALSIYVPDWYERTSITQPRGSSARELTDSIGLLRASASTTPQLGEPLKLQMRIMDISLQGLEMYVSVCITTTRYYTRASARAPYKRIPAC